MMSQIVAGTRTDRWNGEADMRGVNAAETHRQMYPQDHDLILSEGNCREDQAERRVPAGVKMQG